MKKILFFAVGMLLFCSSFLTARSKLSNRKEQFNFKLAHVLPENHSTAMAYTFFAERVKEYSEGQIEISIYPAGTLGDTKQIIEQVQVGTLDFGHAGAAFFESFTQEYAVFSLPYVFENRKHFLAAMRGQFGERFAKDIPAKIGLQSLMSIYAGARSFYTNKPVKSLDDLKGLKIRVQPSRISIDAVKALGAAATPMSFGEVYSALQQGVLDGAENNVPSYVSARHHEVSKYFVYDEHQMMPDFLVVNRVLWQNLQADAQEQISRAAKEAEAYQLQLWDKIEKEALATAQKNGSIFTKVEKAPFQRKTASLLDKASSNEVLAPLLYLIGEAKQNM